jgi:diguanylate cyclase (GGDEF)-like protein
MEARAGEALRFLDAMPDRLQTMVAAVGKTLVNTYSSSPLLRSVVRHPWSSTQDLLLLLGVMLGATILALEYELFAFAGQLTVHERRIDIFELMFLTALLVAGIVAFVVRRLHEERRDVARQIMLDLEMNQLRHQATRDPLTGLPNRRAMLEALAQATCGPQADGHQHVFFLLDLNEFKRVNDLHGHAVGDRVLQVIVERFRSATRANDVFARIGGDEFAVLSHDVDKAGATAIGHRFIACVHSKIWVEGHAHDVGVSIGATIIPDDGVTAPEILRNADLAMYRAKDADRSALVFYEAGAAHPGRSRITGT